MMRILSLILLVTGVAQAENLLANPGFEDLQGSQPAHWSLYVMPQIGSWGRLDSETTLAGKYSISLHIATPYVVDPANNWSQVINVNVQNEDLVVKGSIKSEEATEAAIWLQCFRKSPLSTLDVVSTSDSVPIRGTVDWTLVEAKLKIPAGTDFAVCRCVLKGSGTAWFDNLSVESVHAESEKPAAKADAPQVPIAPGAATTGPTKREASRTPPPQSPGSSSALEDVRRAHQELVEANNELRKSNRAMQEQIKKMKDELQTLRREIQRESQKNVASTNSSKPSPSAPPTPAPPLVPHDYSTEAEH